MLHLVVIEVRQYLCCANVFLNFRQPVTNFESLKINVEKRLIRIKDVSTGENIADIDVGKYFSIRTETFSNLVVDHENIAFRISLENIEFPDQASPTKLHENPTFRLKDNQEASLHCQQCESTFCVLQKYEKVREFPSGTIDVSEFFCHHGPSFSDVLLPRKQDMFYGFQFVVLNMENVKEATKEKEGHVYCRRCQRYLGETMFNGKAVKLWADSIAIRQQSGTELVDIFDTKSHDLLELLMLKVIKETSLPSPETLLRNLHFTKVIFETCQPNRQQQFLLVHILEKQLPILKNNELTKDNEAEVEVSKNHRHVQVKVHHAFKLIYRLIERESDEDILNEPPMLSFWQQDINILNVKISPFLFGLLLETLNKNSLLLPEVYRDNKDSFTLSYIFQ